MKYSWPAPPNIADNAPEDRHYASSKCTSDYAAANPPTATSNGTGYCHDDADDETGFEHFAKDNDQRSEHGCLYVTLLGDQHPSGFRMEIIKKFVATGRKRPKPDDAFAVSRDHLFNSERHAFKFHRRGIEILDF